MVVSAVVLEYMVAIGSPPVITSGDGLAAANVEVMENTLAVTTVTAEDADAGDMLTFSLSGADAGAFSIGSTSGVLVFLDPPEYPSSNYEVTVTVSDGANVDRQDLTVIILDEPDAAPVIVSPNLASVIENLTTVMTVAATDADTPPASLNFSLSGADADKFVVNSPSGLLSFIVAPEF